MSITDAHVDLSLLAVAPSYPDESLNRYRNRVARGISHVLPRLISRLDVAQAATIDHLWELYENLPAERRGDIAQHPLFCSWWIKLKTAVGSNDDARISSLLQHFGRFVLPHALRTGLSAITLPLPLSERGELRFAGHPTHIALPVTGVPEVVVHIDGDDLEVSADSQVWRVPVALLLDGGDHELLVNRPLIAGGEVELDGADPWFLSFYEGQNARGAIEGYAPRDLRPYEPLGDEVIDAMDEAIGFLDAVCPAFGAEFRSYIRIVAPIRSKLVSTFTDTGFFGTLFISERHAPFTNTLLTAEHLLHEASHHRLTLIMEDDPLIESTPDELVTSPWRRDARPMHQILHGTFVFARIAQMLTAAMSHDPDPAIAQRYDAVLKDLRDAVRTLDSPDTRFTAEGSRLVEQFHLLARG